MHVHAFDITGRSKVLHKLEEGDLIEWKRNGSIGFKWGRVTALQWPSAHLPPKVRIMPYTDDKSGPTGERERWIGVRSVISVYDPRGHRKQPLDASTTST